MKIVYSEDHRRHDGASEFHLGEMVPMFEMPRRMDMILNRLRDLGFGELCRPDCFDDSRLLAVHAPDYVEFLSSAWELWCAEGFQAHSALPYAFPHRGFAGAGQRGQRRKPPRTVHGKLGYYAFDLAVPFVAGTWQAVRSSADVALTGQKMVGAGEPAAFALCRPPGHHAMADVGGGYCYLNNAAIAAQAFRDQHASRVAILDVDYHHGNGTQSIFYAREDVLFVSLHGDPEQEYPYYAGYADEVGEGPGEGSNVNFPMPWGTDWAVYADALSNAAVRIREHRADALVVSLGVDTFKADPISEFKLENDDYLRMGEAIAALALPTLFVMEGGYAVEDIGTNTVNVLLGFEQAAPA